LTGQDAKRAKMMLVIALSMRLQIVANVSIWQLMPMAAQVGGRIHKPHVSGLTMI
jgi:hypothetical protein